MKLTDENGYKYIFARCETGGSLQAGVLREDVPEAEPELKKIDMSRCIESGIDCEFSDDREFPNDVIGKLIEIVEDDGFTFRKSSLHKWMHCRPRMNHIHACPVGFDECPLPEGFRARVYMRGVDGQESIATGFNWGRASDILEFDAEIIAFEVTGIVDGWEL